MGSEHPAGNGHAPGREDPGARYDEGGDPVCWAFLVCPECGAVTSEGHRPGCAAARAASGVLLDLARDDAQE